MIGFLKGEIIDLTPTSVMILAAGVGYEISTPLNTLDGSEIGQEVSLHIHLKVSETDMQLFGFSTPKAKVLFKRILAVPGVGPTTGLLIMSSLTWDELFSAIIAEDHGAFEKIKGIGPKTAKQIILDMKRYAEKTYSGPAQEPSAQIQFLDDAITALTSLGITKTAANKAVTEVINSHIPITDVGQLVREALRLVK